VAIVGASDDAPAPEGASDLEKLAVSLKRYPEYETGSGKSDTLIRNRCR
jgi:hypothetical protein